MIDPNASSRAARRSGRVELRVWLSLLLALWVGSYAHAVSAEEADPARATEIYQLGVESFEAGDFGAAAALFRRAWELDPNGRLAFNVARAYERAGNWEAALEFYEIAGTDADDDSVRQRIAEAIERVRAEQAALEPVPEPDEPDEPVEEVATAPAEVDLMGSVSASASVSGSRLRIDGQGTWDLPATIELAPGSYTGRITAPDHRPVPVSVWVEPGGLTRIDVALEPTAPSPTRRIAAWSAIGAGAAFTGAGLLFYMQAQNRYDEAVAIGRTGIDRGRFDATAQTGRTNATLSNVFYGVGAASLVAGMTLLGMEWFGSGPESPRVTAGPGGVRLDWSF
jgi:tetratricopeptide (TPR) repeat protein